jgi:pilus assembly protein Flp/PilA
MRNIAANFFRDQSAVTSIEYALLGSLIAAAIMISVGVAGDSLGNLYAYIKTELLKAAP